VPVPQKIQPKNAIGVDLGIRNKARLRKHRDASSIIGASISSGNSLTTRQLLLEFLLYSSIPPTLLRNALSAIIYLGPTVLLGTISIVSAVASLVQPIQ
jgi:hypothetical protein